MCNINVQKYARIIITALVTVLAITACQQPESNLDKTTDSPTSTQANQDTFSVALNPDRDYLIIVNATQDKDGNYSHRYEFNGDYDRLLKHDLVYLADVVTGEPTPLEKATALAFTQLAQDMYLKGMPIGLYSGYRTEADQQYVFETFGNMEDWSSENTVLQPGFSEHHTGLMANIVVWYSDQGKPHEWFTEDSARTNSDFNLLHNTLADYGFILRYPADKESITGVKYAPYEIRFVGSSKVAHAIMDNGLTLEEYVNTTQ